jgi:hypothetical protein
VEADRQVEVARRIEARRVGGMSERAAIRAEAPGEPETTWVKRIGHFRREGRDGLVSRRRTAAGVRKLTDEVRGVIRGILSESPDFRSPQVRARLEAMGMQLSETVVKRAMKQVGLAKARGAPSRRARIEPLALAGAELPLGVDIEVGATAQLVADLQAALSAVGEVERLRGGIAALADERPRLERRRTIFTVDVELDQILTAFKLTFLNLCSTLLTRYLGGRHLQLDTLIRGILTLPGERETTATTETIRMWRQPRDRDLFGDPTPAPSRPAATGSTRTAVARTARPAPGPGASRGSPKRARSARRSSPPASGPAPPA